MRIFAFDSGTGGLTAIAPLLRAYPTADVYYLGDLANLPYGTKSPERVRQLTLANIRWLLENLGRDRKPDLLILACNTASAHAIDAVQTLALTFGVPAIGVIVSGCKAALADRPARVVVMATSATVQSQTYTAGLRAAGYEGAVIEKACPLFVPLVEEGLTDSPATEWIVRNYLDSILQPGETAILGCTHYPFLRPLLERVYPTVRWIDAGGALIQDADVALVLNRAAKNNASQAEAAGRQRLHLYFTDASVSWQRIAGFAESLQIPTTQFTLNRVAPIL